jgi:carbon monoxide dehydrogenase subunit G
MASAEVSSSVHIASTPAKVWAYVSDWRRQGEWIPLTSVQPLDGPADRVGARVSAFTGVGPVGFTDPMTVTAWEPPNRLEIRHTGRVVRGEATVLVEPAGTGTRLTWQERIDIPGGAAGALGFRLTRPVTQRLLDWSLHRLRTRVEASA